MIRRGWRRSLLKSGREREVSGLEGWRKERSGTRSEGEIRYRRGRDRDADPLDLAILRNA